MKNMKHLLAGFAIGVVMAVAPSCGTAKNCSATTCASGCCDAKGECQLGTSNGACGQLGGTCAVCQIAQACNLGTCSQTTSNGGGNGGGSGGGSGGGVTGGGTGGGVTGGGTGGGVTGGGTGGGVTGGGTGGGVTGGGTGGGVTGGGGGSTCDGCFFQGTCIIRANSNNNTICGEGGVQCATCTGTANCVNYVCTGGTGGGTGGGVPTGGGTGGGGATGLQPIGGACATAGNCQTGLTCKQTTTRGDATYPGGYCTKACAMQTDCGTGNDCIGGAQSALQFYGESTGFCVSECLSAGTQSNCRSGYLCEFNAAGQPGLCWLNPIPPFSGGGQATNSGNPCTADTCQPSNVNPLLSFCFDATMPDGGFSGWTGGNCSADCSYDNVGTFCGPTATCITLGQAPNTSEVCLGTCSGPGTRSTCRAGYSCFGLRAPDGGVSATSICYPDCTITGCQAGTCNTTSGQCQ